MKKDDKNPLRVLLYGLDKLKNPSITRLEGKGWILEGGDYEDAPRFHDYDGVVTFNGIFEQIHSGTTYTQSFFQIEYDQHQLGMRTNQALKLIEGGGFLCFLLAAPLYDSHDGGRADDTDLASYFSIGTSSVVNIMGN